MLGTVAPIDRGRGGERDCGDGRGRPVEGAAAGGVEGSDLRTMQSRGLALRDGILRG